MGKDKVRPLEIRRGLWISQGECRMQPGLDSGREGSKEGQGWYWDSVRTEPMALGGDW